jgi:hypothetical protein
MEIGFRRVIDVGVAVERDYPIESPSLTTTSTMSPNNVQTCCRAPGNRRLLLTPVREHRLHTFLQDGLSSPRGTDAIAAVDRLFIRCQPIDKSPM